MREATRDAAAAMSEDLEHISETLQKENINPGDVRRLSNVLRRLLIDNNGDLRKIAPSRIGLLNIGCPDVKPFFDYDKKEPFDFFALGGAELFGIEIFGLSMRAGVGRQQIENVDPNKRISLRLDGFLSQPVICFQGTWIPRGDAIKFIANVASGVHSSGPREPNHILLNRIRYAATMKLVGPPTIAFNPGVFTNETKPIDPDRSAMDFILLELMAAGKMLIESPDIIRLKQAVDQELQT